MWRSSAGHNMGDVANPNVGGDDDDWETDADFEVSSLTRECVLC